MTEPAADASSPPPAPVQRRRRRIWILAVGLVVAIAVIAAAAALWAPLLAPLFAGGAGRGADLAARIDRLQARQAALDGKLTALDSKLAATDAAIDRRLQALEARPAPAPVDLSGVQRQIAALTATTGTLDTRLDGIDKELHALPKTDPAEAALTLIVLQIGDAVRLAHPFAADYAAFVALARGQPDLLAAAAPLAAPAKAGVASRAVLAETLHKLAAHIATATPPPAPGDWRGRIIATLRSLVTIRRIDGTGQTAAERAVAAAERAMAAGDLAGAVDALRPLSGAAADAARPWLTLAEARVKVEDALDRLSSLLAARLGTAAPAAPPPPG